jgi:hypothetical protein
LTYFSEILGASRGGKGVELDQWKVLSSVASLSGDEIAAPLRNP